METRRITEDDIPACAEIFDVSYAALHRANGTYEEAPPASEWLGPILHHFLLTDPAGGRIASVDGRSIAFASGIRRDRYWFLSFLFVLPDAQGSGVGRRLLQELAPDEQEDDVVRATVVESFQPVSTGLYASVGMTPQAIKYWLGGPSRPDELPQPPGDLRKTELTPADLGDIERLDRALLGFGRVDDHVWIPRV
jgi:GNAT superfamily N-acetyltransferase